MTIEQQAIYATGWLTRGGYHHAVNTLTDIPLVTYARSQGMELPNAWVPIDTAPKDGTAILLFRWRDSSYTVGEWEESYEDWVDIDWRRFSDATHWQPLPEPPTEATL